MSKSKEQCLNIISQRLLKTSNENHINDKLLALEESLKEISDSQYSLIWTYDKETNTLRTKNFKLSMSESVLETVFLSKKVFFDNHLQSHKKYNQKLDNPLDIEIQSIIILPILDNEKKDVRGFISAFSSMTHKHEFRRYDTRSISLLTKYAQEIIEHLLQNNFNLDEVKVSKENRKKKVNKPTLKTVSVGKRKTKNDLENELKTQREKIIELEKLLEAQKEEIKSREEEKKNTLPEALNRTGFVNNFDELQHIFNFLTNEVTYFSNEQHTLYTFLEMIKNSLHDSKQLSHIDKQLKNSQLLNKLLDANSSETNMVKKSEEFKTFEAFSSVVNLYLRAFSNQNITFNVFIDPLLPHKLVSDIDKIQSIIVHLINNMKGLIGLNGVLELSVRYLDGEESLEITLKGIHPEEEKKITNFFKSSFVSNSLTSKSSGLGLSISSNLINILGAKLKLTTEENNQYSFVALIPVKRVKIVEPQKEFKNKKPLKIGILLNSENEYAYLNLRRYLNAFSIDRSNIVIFNNYKKLSNLKISHFICFENMLSPKIDMQKFSSITILKYSDEPLVHKYTKNIKINELSVNGYYGMALQQILFPDVAFEALSGNTLLIQETFLEKITHKFKR